MDRAIAVVRGLPEKIRRYRARAEELRTVSEELRVLSNPQRRVTLAGTTLREVAASYDKMADQLERILSLGENGLQK